MQAKLITFLLLLFLFCFLRQISLQNPGSYYIALASLELIEKRDKKSTCLCFLRAGFTILISIIQWSYIFWVCNHHHNRGMFLSSLKKIILLLSLPALINHSSTLWLYKFAFSSHCLLFLNIMIQGQSMLWHVSLLLSFLLITFQWVRPDRKNVFNSSNWETERDRFISVSSRPAWSTE